ncbi:MAG TPA: hypothetical protein VM451_01305 [Candidatus Limnocylindria bacterium]|nr:hypothetical protein [Candidatus Limnocylindria bacterium]
MPKLSGRLAVLTLCLIVAAPVASAAARPLPGTTPRAAPVAAASVSRFDSESGPAVVAAGAIVPGSVNRASLAVTATYAVDAAIAVSTGVIKVATTINATNHSGAGVDRFELNTIATRLGSPFSITSASVDGSPVTATVSDQTLLVPLGGVLPDGSSTQIKIGYLATLRTGTTGSNWMFTRYNGTLAMYRWIPWVSLNRPFDRPNHGDPFVTPSSPSVSVKLTLDRSMVVAAPGASLPTALSKTWQFTMANVRDVNLVLAPDFTVTRSTVNGIAVRAYSRPGGYSGTKLGDVSRAALAKEATRLGVAYPWASFTVVETAGGYGLESPSMVWIPSNTASASLTYLVYHEIAHQWFYGMVGNDQQREPFADEGAADMLARTVLGTLRGSRCAKDELDRRITGYSSSCYYETIYVQGANKLNSLRSTIGTTAFWNAIRTYLNANKFKLSTTKKLLEAIRAATSVNLVPTLHARFPTLY